MWLFVFSTDLLLQAVTFICGILDEPFPILTLELIQTLGWGEQCRSRGCIVGSCCAESSWVHPGKHHWLETWRYLALRSEAGICTSWSVWMEVAVVCIYHLCFCHCSTSPCHCFLNREEGRCGWGRGSTVDQNVTGAFCLQTSCLGSGFCFGKTWCLVDVASLKRAWNGNSFAS